MEGSDEIQYSPVKGKKLESQMSHCSQERFLVWVCVLFVLSLHDVFGLVFTVSISVFCVYWFTLDLE